MAGHALLDTLTTHLDDEASRFLLDYGKRRVFGPGELMVREGDPCEQVYIVLEGDANVIKDDSHRNSSVIATVGKGAIIGEMGVFMDLKRSATIRAKGELIALELPNDDFVNALLNFPALTVRLLRSLSTKLNDLNHRFVDSQHRQHLLYLAACILDAFEELEGTAGVVRQDAQPRVELTRIHLDLERIALDSGYSPLDLSNALLHMVQLAQIRDLHFRTAKQVDFNCCYPDVKTFLQSAAQAPLTEARDHG